MFWIAVLLGVVEGLTEFLPVSSTGHLILTSELIGFGGTRAEVFTIFIQLGAILAVVWEYRRRLVSLVLALPRDEQARRFAANVGISFLPAAALGLMLHRAISRHLFTPTSVALALITGAVAILVVEGLPLSPRTRSTETLSRRQALLIGLAQCTSLWPGVSRSAATILGGLGVGLDRRTATEFSFFLAIPTMFAATLFELARNFQALQPGDLLWLALAFAVSFLVALLAVRWLLRFVSTHDLRLFAWWRLAVGALVLLLPGRF